MTGKSGFGKDWAIRFVKEWDIRSVEDWTIAFGEDCDTWHGKNGILIFLRLCHLFWERLYHLALGKTVLLIILDGCVIGFWEDLAMMF